MEGKVYSYSDNLFLNSNYNELKNNIDQHNFFIELKEINQEQTISVYFVNKVGDFNNYLIEAPVKDILDLKAFLDEIAILTKTNETKKIIKSLLQINKYYGGRQSLEQNDAGFCLSLAFEHTPELTYRYEDLKKLLADLCVVKKKMNKEKIKNIVTLLIETLND